MWAANVLPATIVIAFIGHLILIRLLKRFTRSKGVVLGQSLVKRGELARVGYFRSFLL
jgi:hypothetical protein